MKRISAKEVLRKYIDEKSCVVVYPKTEWIEKEKDNEKLREKVEAVMHKLGFISENWFVLFQNDYFIFEFKDRVEAEKFFFSFDKYTHDPEEPFYIQLYIKGEFEGENT